MEIREQKFKQGKIVYTYAATDNGTITYKDPIKISSGDNTYKAMIIDKDNKTQSILQQRFKTSTKPPEKKSLSLLNLQELTRLMELLL